MRIETTPIRRVLPQSVRTLTWALSLLLLAEVGLRGRAWYRYGVRGPVAEIYELDDAGRRQLKPGAELAGSHRQVHVNRLGFRGHELEVPKPPGMTRIVAVGDSTTFGMEASDDEAVWVSQLVTELGGWNGARFDAVNAGVPGYTLADSAALLASRIAPLEPDIIIVSQVATDIAAHSRRQFGRQAKQSEPSSGADRFLEKHSLLLNLINVNTAPLTAQWLSPGRRDYLDHDGVDRYAAQLADLVKSCRERGWRVVLCTAPRSFGDCAASKNQFDLAASALTNNPALSLAGLNDAFDRYNAAIRDVARSLEIPLIDLDRGVPRGAEFFVDAVHFNDAGHRLVGRAIAMELRRVLESETVARGTP